VTNEYVVQAVHQGGMRFSGTIGEHSFRMDYPLKPGAEVAGPKPMEMLLASLASCAGGTVAALMRRSGQTVEGLTVTARGQRRVEHPTIFTSIDLEFVLRGSLDPATVTRVLEQAESQVCPVWAMLKPSTPISSSFRVAADT
jgi:putative redox protein